MVREWIKSKVKLLNSRYNINRFRIEKNNSPADLEMENLVYEWILNKRNEGVCMRGAMIKHKAIEFSKNESFTAPLGWFERFMIRKN